jgi:hypothetical protein
MQTPQKPTEKSEVVQVDTSTTAIPGGNPASSEDVLVRDVDPSTFIPPEQQDILLTDVTSERLHTKIGDTLGVEYLSIAKGAQQRFMTDDAKRSRGLLMKPNNRYMINLVCRRDSSKRNNMDSDSPKAPTTWHNVFFSGRHRVTKLILEQRRQGGSDWSREQHPLLNARATALWGYR